MTDHRLEDPEIAVLIPCYNEERSIARVIEDFRGVLPDAAIYVYDNNSTDRTAEVAEATGAVVRGEPLQGKGNVVRRMFADVEADVYVLVDGDDTYEAAAAPGMIRQLMTHCLDMVNAVRVAPEAGAFRRGHRFGNRLLTGMVALVFGSRIHDMLSGYRCLSQRYVKSFPALTTGFEIETELTVHALELRMPIAEVATAYRERPPGSMSKLSTARDGARILRTIIGLVREERPLLFFGSIGGVLALAAVVLVWPVVTTYLQTGLVPRLPTAILATGMMLSAFLSLACGLILDTVTRGRLELKRFQYLSLSRRRHPDAGRSTGAVPPPNASEAVRAATRTPGARPARRPERSRGPREG